MFAEALLDLWLEGAFYRRLNIMLKYPTVFCGNSQSSPGSSVWNYTPEYYSNTTIGMGNVGGFWFSAW